MSDVSTTSSGSHVAEPIDTSVAPDAALSGALDVREAVAGLNSTDASFYSTLKVEGFADRLALGKAINNSEPLDEHLGEVFNLANYIVQAVEITDGQTGEMIIAPRVILISDAGVAYHGTSKGLLTAIRNLNATVGEPSTWEGNTLAVKVVMKGTRPRQYFTIEYI